MQHFYQIALIIRLPGGAARLEEIFSQRAKDIQKEVDKIRQLRTRRGSKTPPYDLGIFKKVDVKHLARIGFFDVEAFRVFSKKIIQEKGLLVPNNKDFSKAQRYLKAIEEYPDITVPYRSVEDFGGFSGYVKAVIKNLKLYKNNILEKDAQKAADAFVQKYGTISITQSGKL